MPALILPFVMKWILAPVGNFFGYIMKPSRLVVWLPLVFLACSIIFAGIFVKNYIHKADANSALVVQQGQQIKGLTTEVETERQSVVTATKNIQTYTRAVQVYAQKQEVYQQQVATVRQHLNPAPIVQKAQTNAQGASADVTRSYADLLGMFDSATAVPVAGGGSPTDSSKTTVTTTVTRQDTTRPVASPQKRDTGP